MLPPLKYWDLNDEIPRHLPLLDLWLEKEAPSQPLRGFTVLNIQHQLGNHVPQTCALLELGVSPQDLYWIDIPYSATAAVREVLFDLGIPGGNVHVSDFRLLNAYAPYQRCRVASLVSDFLDNPPERLVVLDDGSYFLEALADLQGRLPSVAIVEQTTRGLIKIEDNPAVQACAATVPLVNVARSRPKTTLEPPFIGIAITEVLGERLAVLRGGLWDGCHCLVLGYGAIGRQVARFLADAVGLGQLAIYVHDVDLARMAQAKADGFRIWDRGCALRFDVVVGCSGRASFGVGDRVYLEDGAVLASATSGTVELSREDFIELADKIPDDEISIERDGLDEMCVHSDITFHFGDRSVTFLNGGFPINFNGRINTIPPHYIQPTPTMMCAGALQASKASEARRIELDPEFCCWLDEQFRAQLGDEAHLVPHLSR
jgi:S-adenosylhomocysteine hydrolase